MVVFGGGVGCGDVEVVAGYGGEGAAVASHLPSIFGGGVKMGTVVM